MAKFDAGEVSQLLQIPALISTNAPQMTAILGEAMSRLREINDGIEAEKAKKPKSPHEYPGQPSHLHPTPSKPLEDPKSEVAKSAPKEDVNQGPRAIPANVHNDDNDLPPVRRV